MKAPSRLSNPDPLALYGDDSRKDVVAVIQQGLAAFMGDSITKNGDLSSALQPVFWGDGPTAAGRGYPLYAHMLSGGKLAFNTSGTVVHATGGLTSSQIVAKHLPQVLALDPRPQFCVLNMGTNDSRNSIAEFRQTFLNIKTAALKLAEAGIVPVLTTLLPRTDTGQNGYHWLHVAIQRLAVAYGWPFVDLFGVLADPLGSGSVASAGDLADNVHPSNTGARKIGQAVVNALSEWLNEIPSPILAQYNNPPATDSANMFANALFGTDSNSDGIPDGWTVAGGAATYSLASDANVKGNLWTITRNGSDVSLQSNILTLVPGNRYRFGIALKSIVKAAGARFSLRVRPTDFSNGGVGVTDIGEDVPSSSVLTFEWVQPSNWATNQVRLYLAVAGGNGSLGVAQPTLVDLTAQGIA